ncbi:MAG: hypothetical protein R3E83_03175 [Burkholderiaceae bacterium]
MPARAQSSGRASLQLRGRWWLEDIEALQAALAGLDLAAVRTSPVALDTSALSGIDTAGAMLLLQRLGERGGSRAARSR